MCINPCQCCLPLDITDSYKIPVGIHLYAPLLCTGSTAQQLQRITNYWEKYLPGHSNPVFKEGLYV